MREAVKAAALVTQVAQAIVPVVVMAPPVMGEVVAILVTVPPAPGAPPSIRRPLASVVT